MSFRLFVCSVLFWFGLDFVFVLFVLFCFCFVLFCFDVLICDPTPQNES